MNLSNEGFSSFICTYFEKPAEVVNVDFMGENIRYQCCHNPVLSTLF